MHNVLYIDVFRESFLSDFVSFISVFQLADAKEVMQEVHHMRGVRLPVLTPNLKVRTSRRTIKRKVFIQNVD